MTLAEAALALMPMHLHVDAATRTVRLTLAPAALATACG